MPGTMLSHLERHTGESLDYSGPRRLAEADRISICHVSAGRAWAGAEVHVATLLRALSRHPELDLHSIALHDGRLAHELRSFGVKVQVVSEHKSFPRLIFECAQFVKSRKVHVLHSHNYKENLIALLLSRICKVPHLIRTEHGHPEPYSIAGNPKHWGVVAADRLAARHTPAGIIAVSSDLGEYWKRHADPRKVTVLRNAVDVKRVRSNFNPAEAKQRLGINPGNFVVGIAARLELIKRHDLFLATACYLAGKCPSSTFVIAGGGDQRRTLDQMIVQLGLEDRVHLLGERNDVYDVLRAMDVLLICSDHEGIPMVMLEAMALGVVVVSRKVGGIPEVIEDGVTGILVPSKDPEELGRACLSIFERPRVHADITEAAREEIHRKYSADSHANTVLELYKSISRRPVN